MNIKRAHRANSYTTIDNVVLNDQALSPVSLGVLLYILSKPPGWQARKTEILTRFSQSSIGLTKNALDSCFRELRHAGYIRIVPIKSVSPDGAVSFHGSEYVFYDLPQRSDMAQSSEVGKSSEVGTFQGVGNFGDSEKLAVELVNKDLLVNKDITNKERENTPAHEKNEEPIFDDVFKKRKVAPKEKADDLSDEPNPANDHINKIISDYSTNAPLPVVGIDWSQVRFFDLGENLETAIREYYAVRSANNSKINAVAVQQGVAMVVRAINIVAQYKQSGETLAKQAIESALLSCASNAYGINQNQLVEMACRELKSDKPQAQNSRDVSHLHVNSEELAELFFAATQKKR